MAKTLSTSDLRVRMKDGKTLSDALYSVIDEESSKILSSDKVKYYEKAFSWINGERGIHRNLTRELDKLLKGEKLTENGRHIYFNMQALPYVFEAFGNVDGEVKEYLDRTKENAQNVFDILAKAGYNGRILPLKEDLSRKTRDKIRNPLSMVLYRLAQAMSAYDNPNVKNN